MTPLRRFSLMHGRISFSVLLLLYILCLSSAHSQSGLRNVLEVEGTPGSGMLLGMGISGLGDINNDGWPDFAVSAEGVGKTFFYFGGPHILDGNPDVVLKGGDNMVMGDLNGDGFRDLIIHRISHEYGATDSIYVYYGKAPSPLALDTIPGLIIAGENITESWFGREMAIGDLDNDGFDDLVISAPLYGQVQGRVYVYLGKAQMTNTPDFVVTGDKIRIQFGSEVRMGDINGDGIPDLAVGSGDFGIAEKALDIYYGKPEWTFTKNGYSQHLSSNTFGVKYLFQFSLCDVNVDGKADVVLFSENNDTAYFYYGGGDSIRYKPNLTWTSPDTTRWRGFMASCFDIGDINGDGKRDFVLGAYPGGGPAATILVYFGLTNPVNKPVAVRSRGFVGSNAFFEVVPLGDVDGDGFNDFGTVVPYVYQAITQDGYFVILQGDPSLTGTEIQSKTPAGPILSQNYPNPFNPTTIVEFYLTAMSDVVLVIYDMLGREVRKLVDQKLEPGTHKVMWDGKDSRRQRVASGPYLCQMRVNGKVRQSKKLVFLK
jgi:hypothetical protein